MPQRRSEGSGGCRRSAARAVLLYWRLAPFRRGKWRIGHLASRLVGPVVLASNAGPKLDVLLDSAQDRHLVALDPSPGDLLVEEIRGLRAGGVFVDVGANVGLYSFLAAEQLGSDGVVLSIEASDREFVRLLNGIRANSAQNVVAIYAAAGSASGTARMDPSVGHTGMNRVARGGPAWNNGVSIPLFRLDDLVDGLLKDRVLDLMKIDVEGFELHVLEGMEGLLRSQRIDRLVVEVTDSYLQWHGRSRQELYDYMTRVGYTPQIKSDSWQYDELFVPTHVAFAERR